IYRMYYSAAEKIERQDARNLRVILDYELKKRVYRELAKLGPDRESTAKKKEIAERHSLQLVRGKIPLPDLRIEYETREGDMARVDLELATEHYRGRTLAEKVRAGFSIYAHAQDAAGLRRVMDQRGLTAEVLSLWIFLELTSNGSRTSATPTLKLAFSTSSRCSRATSLWDTSGFSQAARTENAPPLLVRNFSSKVTPPSATTCEEAPSIISFPGPFTARSRKTTSA